MKKKKQKNSLAARRAEFIRLHDLAGEKLAAERLVEEKRSDRQVYIGAIVFGIIALCLFFTSVSWKPCHP